jgi:steroid 5-alpha reductase family enzyme
MKNQTALHKSKVPDFSMLQEKTNKVFPYLPVDKRREILRDEL